MVMSVIQRQEERLNRDRSLGASAFASETPLLLNFHNLLRDLTGLAALCWRRRFDWRRLGFGGVSVYCGEGRGGRNEIARRFSIRDAQAGKSHHLVHHNGLRLPTKSDGLKW
jgi:hypothetical protein